MRKKQRDESMKTIEHFGVKLISRSKGFKLTRDEFAIINTKPSLPYSESLARRNGYVDEQGSAYSDSWCAEYRELCLKNFDFNMEYFSKLDKAAFDDALSSFLSQYKKFVEVTNLNNFNGVEGYYIMVLDEYKQVYIGKTDNIKKRITTHWSATKSFDRILFPMYAWDKSVFSIDFFRALDTTRIFAWKKRQDVGIEAELINNFPSQFCTNRIGGDVTNALQAMGTIHRR